LKTPLKRKFWISALLPYFFITIIAFGLILVTALNAAIDAENQHHTGWRGFDLLVQNHLSQIFYTVGVLGLVLLFTLFYKIMPIAHISYRRALAGGLTATILWEGVRHLLVFYYANVSMVNVVYGSMATIVIVLLTMEAIALILLLGAQVIADLQASAHAGLAWYEEPPDDPLKKM
jgi:membrane protein